MDRPPPLIELMRAQDGLVTRGQALRCGLSRDQVRYRCSLGEWVAVYPGVFRFAGTPLTVRSSIRAAGLWVGPPGWVSGIAALYWWGLSDRPSSDVEVTVPRRRFLQPPSGIAIRRSDLQVADTTVLDGLSVTHQAYSALYGATCLGREGAAVLDRALQRSVPIELADQAAARYPRSRWSRAARQLLEAARDGEAISERLLVRELRRAGIGGWTLGHAVSLPGMTAWLDLAFVAKRVAIEVDGWAWHQSPDRFQRDRRRQNALILAGWMVLRFTWFDLTLRPAFVIEEIRRALASSRARVQQM